MTTFTTRCPACHGLNRIPTNKIDDSPKCGKCQADLVDGLPIEATELNFDAILTSNQPVVVDFWAPWCNPCVGFAPVFHDSAIAWKNRCRFVKVDTEAQQALAAKFQIRSIPTIMVFKHGVRVDMINGALPKSQFEQWLTQAINK
jgi:thioredoxin 2